MLQACCVSRVGQQLAYQNTDAFHLELDQEKRFVAHRLNRASIDCNELPEADHVWMPVRML